MPQFLKRFILRILDYTIRVVLRRADLIRQAEKVAAVQAAVEETIKKTGNPDPTGWRMLRVRPFIYPAAPGAPARTDTDPRYFLVTSQGLAASAWLASSLNLHPEITCSMGIDHPLVSMRFYYNGDQVQERSDSIVDPAPLRHGFYSETLRKHFKQKFADLGVSVDGDLVRQNPIRMLQSMYEELQWFEPKSRHYGNVHVCFAQQALEYLREFPADRDIAMVNLIRHPIPRTEAAIKGVLSVATHYQDSDWHRGITEGIDAIVETQAERRREIERRFGVDFGNVRNRAVLYSYCRALHNDCWAGEITGVPEACHVTIERLMTQRDYFAWLVWEITNHEIMPSKEFLDQLFTETHLQSGRHMGKGRSAHPRAQYEAWTEWERYEFKQVMERLDLAGVYAPFGYDFSFVH